jgi:hypothetical protein
MGKGKDGQVSIEEQENAAREALKEVKTALDEMRLAGFHVIYGDKIPEWAHPGSVGGVRRQMEDGRYDVRWIYYFLQPLNGIKGWSCGDPFKSMPRDECIEKLVRWATDGEWDDPEE